MATYDYSTLQWRRLTEYPDYEVSESGDVRRLTKGYRLPAGAVLRPSIGSHGYPVYNLYMQGHKTTLEAHALVAQAFLGPKPFPGAQVAHWDGDPSHNHYTNLRWTTATGNRNDQKRHGRGVDGEKNPSAKLTWALVEEIREKHATGAHTLVQLAEEYKVTFQAIWRVVRFKNWHTPHSDNPVVTTLE